MKAEEKKQHFMDLRGLDCPVPVIKVNHHLKKINRGDVIIAETTDPDAFIHFSSWSETSGYKIIKTVIEKDAIKFYIMK